MDLRRISLSVLLSSACFLIPSAVADVYPVILHGKVVMPDGSAPPTIVAIERVCSDNFGSEPGPLTNKKGEFIWRMNIDPLETRDCVIRATHAGYSSTQVEVSGVDTTHTTLDLPPITISASVADPYTLNFSDTGITGRAKGDWNAALKALDAHNLAEVATHLEAVVAAAPKAGQAWHALGVVDEQLDKTAGARAAYEHAIASDPKQFRAYVTLTRLCIKTKDWNCAAMTAEELLKADPKHSLSRDLPPSGGGTLRTERSKGRSGERNRGHPPGWESEAAPRRVCTGTDFRSQGRHRWSQRAYDQISAVGARSARRGFGPRSY